MRAARHARRAARWRTAARWRAITTHQLWYAATVAARAAHDLPNGAWWWALDNAPRLFPRGVGTSRAAVIVDLAALATAHMPRVAPATDAQRERARAILRAGWARADAKLSAPG